MKTETNLQAVYRKLVKRAEAEAIEADRRGEDYEDWVHDITAGNNSLTKLAKFLDDAFICDDHFSIEWNFRRMMESDDFSDEEKKEAEKLLACCKLFFELGSIILNQTEKFAGKVSGICQDCSGLECDCFEANLGEVRS